MREILSFYNRNRIFIWVSILIIVFVIIMIRMANSAAVKESKSGNDQETTLNNVVSYDNESKSIISGGDVPKEYSDDIGEIINTFYTYCCNHEPEKAYDMLTDEMKNLKYKNLQSFVNNYYTEKFEGNKEFSFNSWITKRNANIYIVNIYDNMLATGKSSKDEYIEDYITVVPVEDTYKINVDGYIGREEINKEVDNDNINIKLTYKDLYLDYEIDNFYVKNKTNNTIMLDPMENTKSTYLTDSNQIKYDAMVYENKKEDMILNPDEYKSISIKFNVSYRDDLVLKNVNFTKIVNYDEYQNDKNVEAENIEIDL